MKNGQYSQEVSQKAELEPCPKKGEEDFLGGARGCNRGVLCHFPIRREISVVIRRTEPPGQFGVWGGAKSWRIVGRLCRRRMAVVRSWQESIAVTLLRIIVCRKNIVPKANPAKVGGHRHAGRRRVGLWLRGE